MTNSYVPHDQSDVTKLVEAYPLCWLVTGGADDRLATPLPLLPETDAQGTLQSLLGHIPRSHPQHAALQRDPRATVLCMGPQGYISPRLVSNLTWGPTWNYASCRFEVDVELVAEETDFALLRLAEALEGNGPQSWRPERMGDRYDELKPRIIAFRARLREVHARFKLGQDEADATFDEIVEHHPNRELADWMRTSRG